MICFWACLRMPLEDHETVGLRYLRPNCILCPYSRALSDLSKSGGFYSRHNYLQLIQYTFVEYLWTAVGVDDATMMGPVGSVGAIRRSFVPPDRKRLILLHLCPTRSCQLRL
jgi:hypothetical protein